MYFRGFLFVFLLLGTPLFSLVQTIPIEQEVATLVTKEMATVKPEKMYSKYEYRSASRTKDLLTIIIEQREEIRSLQKDLQLSKFEIKKMEARIQLLENRMQRNYLYFEDQ